MAVAAISALAGFGAPVAAQAALEAELTAAKAKAMAVHRTSLPD